MPDSVQSIETDKSPPPRAYAWAVRCGLTIAFAVLTATIAAAETRRFEDPSVRGYRLDFCKHWGRDCGEPAATLWCRERGFERATRFAVEQDIGARTPTVVFGDGRLCSEASCDGFAYIECARGPDSEPGTPRPGPIQLPKSKQKPASEFEFTLKPGLFAPSPAALSRCVVSDCGITNRAKYRILPSARSQSESFLWDVSRVPGATGVGWQVSVDPFTTDDPARQSGIVASGLANGVRGRFPVDFKATAARLTYLPALFYVRVIPVSSATQRAAGAPSNVLEVYYGTDFRRDPPNLHIFQEQEISRIPGPQVSLVSFTYTAWSYNPRWPANCKEWRPKKSDGPGSRIKKVGEGIIKAWDWVSDAYGAAKDMVVEIADKLTLGLFPKGAWSLALDGALASVGIPPEIPNLDAVLKGNLDYMAKEVARQAVAQIPAGELAVTTGNLVADISVNAAVEIGEEKLRAELEQEIESRTRQAVSEGADALAKAVKKKNKDNFCTGLVTYPTYFVTLRNTGAADARNFEIRVWDSEAVFHPKTVTLSLRAGETLRIPVFPEAKIREVQKSQLVGRDRSANERHWFNEIVAKLRTRVQLAVDGDTVCTDPVGPETRHCRVESRTLRSSNGRFLLSRDQSF